MTMQTGHLDHSAVLSCSVTLNPGRCKHCKSPLLGKFAQKEFCCQGCEAVFHYINRLGLSKFYQLLSTRAIAKAETEAGNLIELYDQPQFSTGFSTLAGDGRTTARLFVRGLDCYACVWLIKSYLEEQFADVEIALSISESELSITYYADRLKLSSLVAAVQKIGFPVQPAFIKPKGLSRSDELIRVGVNAFCFINVMMLALPEYVDEKLIGDFGFWQLFRYISMLLAAVVMTYGAMPFYLASWVSIRNRKASVDLPIALALVLTFGYSVVNTLRGDGPVYFDSVTVVVTLILTSRYFQGRIVERAERAIRGKFDYSFDYVKQEVDGHKVIVPASAMREGGNFYVLPGDPVPLRSHVVAGSGAVDYGQITGEAALFDVQPGAVIQAGAVVHDSRLDLVSLEEGNVSYIAKIKTAIERMALDRGRYAQFSDRLGTFFFIVVLAVASGIFIHFWPIAPEVALARTVSALLIACPCAFALSVPLTMTMATALGARRGIIFKNQRAIEILGRVQRIFFDKTGTLTLGEPQVIEYQLVNDVLLRHGFSTASVMQILGSLDKFSAHHVAIAMAEFADRVSGDDVIESPGALRVSEEFGQGLRIHVGDRTLLLGQREFCGLGVEGVKGGYNVFLSVGGEFAGGFLLDDRLLDDAKSTVSQLHSRRIQVGIISGDRGQRTEAVAASLEIDQGLVYTEQGPFEKVSWVDDAQKMATAMVGNGFNDSLVLSASGVGISVAGAGQKAKEVAGINIEAPGIAPLLEAIDLAKIANRKVLTAFAFAVVFNLIGLTLAAFGMMTPLVAAILMPCSSITVTLISIRWVGKRV